MRRGCDFCRCQLTNGGTWDAAKDELPIRPKTHQRTRGDESSDVCEGRAQTAPDSDGKPKTPQTRQIFERRLSHVWKHVSQMPPQKHDGTQRNKGHTAFTAAGLELRDSWRL